MSRKSRRLPREVSHFNGRPLFDFKEEILMSLSSADAAFAHLQELLDELLGMQELAEKVRLAYLADEATALDHELMVAQTALALRESDLAEARAQLEAAESVGDAARVDHFRREVLFYADQAALAKGPVNEAEFRIGGLLKREHAESLQALQAHALEAAALADLDARIAAYQGDYQRTYDLCQSLEGSGGPQD